MSSPQSTNDSGGVGSSGGAGDGSGGVCNGGSSGAGSSGVDSNGGDGSGGVCSGGSSGVDSNGGAGDGSGGVCSGGSSGGAGDGSGDVCSSVAGSAGRKRRSLCSHSCGRWCVDTESLTKDVLEDVGLSLMADDSSGLPTPPDSQPETTPTLKPGASRPLQDPYLMDTDGYVPEGFLVYKRRKMGAGKLFDPFSCLSNELLLKIFSLLSKSVLVRCARVCRRWRQAAFDEVLWRRVDAAGKTLPPGGLGRLLVCGVRVLRLARAEISTPLFREPPTPGSAAFHSKLLYLDLSMAGISEQGLEALLEHCRALQKLSLERCPLTERACAAIGQNQHLSALNMALAVGITATGLAHVLAGCTRLEEVNLGWTELSSAALSKLAAAIPTTVTRLNLSGCKDALNDQHVRQLLRRVGSRLQLLDLSDATCIGQAAFDAMMQHLTDIRRIGLSRCYSIPAVNCVQLGHLSTLTHMEMFNCFKESGVDTLRRALPNLAINTEPLSTVARPTVGNRRTSIWEQRVRD